MNFEFKCPQCGQMVEADEAYRGQVAECPHCGKGIVVPRSKPKVQVEKKKRLINTQGQAHSSGESITASHKLVANPTTAISNKWVWCLAIIPLVTVWTLSILVDSLVGYLAGFTLIVIFVILVCLSTVFLKQHSVLDGFAAVPMCLLGELILYGGWWKNKISSK